MMGRVSHHGSTNDNVYASYVYDLRHYLFN